MALITNYAPNVVLDVIALTMRIYYAFCSKTSMVDELKELKESKESSFVDIEMGIIDEVVTIESDDFVIDIDDFSCSNDFSCSDAIIDAVERGNGNCAF